MSDVQNPVNESGLATAVWTFDVSGGYNIHRISIDIVAYGDFEGPRPVKGGDIADEMIVSGGVTTNSPLFDFRLTEAQDSADITYQVFMDGIGSRDPILRHVLSTFFMTTGDWDCLIANATPGTPGPCPGDTVDWHPDDDGGAVDDGIANNGSFCYRRLAIRKVAPRGLIVEINSNGTFNEVNWQAYRDPLIEQGSGIQLDNTKKTFTKVIKESGHIFTLNMVAAQNSTPRKLSPSTTSCWNQPYWVTPTAMENSTTLTSLSFVLG